MRREALVLRYYADLSGIQIAAVMGISVGTAKRHIWRALSALRSMLKWEALASAMLTMASAPRPRRGLHSSPAPSRGAGLSTDPGPDRR